MMALPIAVLSHFIILGLLGYSDPEAETLRAATVATTLIAVMGILYIFAPATRRAVERPLIAVVALLFWPCAYLALMVSGAVEEGFAMSILLSGLVFTAMVGAGRFFVPVLDAWRVPPPSGFRRTSHIPSSDVGLLSIPPSYHKVYAGLEERSQGTEPPPSSLVRGRR